MREDSAFKAVAEEGGAFGRFSLEACLAVIDGSKRSFLMKMQRLGVGPVTLVQFSSAHCRSFHLISDRIEPRGSSRMTSLAKSLIV
ncbi:MAG: hypothetical protein QGF59_19545, partial [Pirellulaceae bacterium]|nr:hypothetical protein [Pirellulaceae bacterium]